MVVMRLALEQSLMVISATGIVLYAKVYPLYNVLQGVVFHINYIVHKHFDKSLYIGSSDPTCGQNFSSISLVVFEILALIAVVY